MEICEAHRRNHESLLDPPNERPFILPMEYPAAKELAEYLLCTVIDAAPELFVKH